MISTVQTIYLKILAIAVFLALTGCDEEIDNRRLANRFSDDLRAKKGADLRIYLPDRSEIEAQDPAIIEQLNSYYIKIVPEGQRCEDEELIELQDQYEDNKLLEFRTQRNCDYRLELILGYKDPKITNPQAKNHFNSVINYEDHIQPLIVANCLSCHPEYSSYSEIFPELNEIVFQVEHKLMPPTEPLSSEDIAKFLAWQANDFVESNPNMAEEGSLAEMISAVYYRNNLNTIIFEYLMLSLDYFIYQDSLWLQKDGEEAGFETIELLVLEPLNITDSH